jgi:hypothetical protein
MYVIQISLLKRDEQGNVSETGSSHSWALEHLAEAEPIDQLSIAMSLLQSLGTVMTPVLRIAKLIK